MISSSYQDEIRALHRDNSSWGSRGYNWAYLIYGIAAIEECRSVLDFGCGKGTLSATLKASGMVCDDYDPGIPIKSGKPFPADLVVATDVLEHVEPEFVDQTILELVRLSRKRLFVSISTRPAGKILPSRRNAHLTVQPGEWWRQKFIDRGFSIRRVWQDRPDWWTALMNAPGK